MESKPKANRPSGHPKLLPAQRCSFPVFTSPTYKRTQIVQRNLERPLQNHTHHQPSYLLNGVSQRYMNIRKSACIQTEQIVIKAEEQPLKFVQIYDALEVHAKIYFCN